MHLLYIIEFIVVQIFIIKQQNIMEEIVEVRFYQWYVRKWDNAFFYN